ncbi:MAG: ABC transporter permease [Chlorobium limicola]|jgi:lipoprotein-releasing system permease protein|nr:ABC transporter permease [Chlorobium limicola]
MNPVLYIARRFAFRERTGSKPAFIVLASVIGIAVGTAALILTLSIVKGFAGSVENKLISFTSHIQVRQSDEEYFSESRYVQRQISGSRGIASASPFLEKSFIVRSRPAKNGNRPPVKPVILKGISADERKIFLKRYLVDEKKTPDISANTISLYLGKTLAEKLQVKSGEKILLAGLDRSTKEGILDGNQDIIELLSSLDLETGLIKGIYDTGLQEGFDDMIIIGDLDEMQQRFHPGLISGYDIQVQDLQQLDAIARNLAARLAYPFYTFTVFERYANLFEWLKLQKNISPLLIITISVVAVFNIISTLLVLVIEKTREIGMLIALGLEPAKVSLIFLGQSLLISLAGVAAGSTLALSLSLFEQRFHLITLPEKSYFIKYVPLLIDPMDYLAVSVSVIMLTMLFAFIPARIAATLKPGTALTT